MMPSKITLATGSDGEELSLEKLEQLSMEYLGRSADDDEVMFYANEAWMIHDIIRELIDRRLAE